MVAPTRGSWSSSLSWTSLSPTHPLRVLAEEHTIIMALLHALEIERDRRPFDVARIEEILRGLLAAEPHEQREDQALLPALEAHGVDAAAQAIRIEHEEIRRAKHHLHRLVLQASSLHEDIFHDRFVTLATFVVSVARAHIEKEMSIVFPIALRTLGDDEWRDIEHKCARIGPCHFPTFSFDTGVAHV